MALMIEHLSGNFHFEKHIKDEQGGFREILQYRDVFSRLFHQNADKMQANSQLKLSPPRAEDEERDVDITVSRNVDLDTDTATLSNIASNGVHNRTQSDMNNAFRGELKDLVNACK